MLVLMLIDLFRLSRAILEQVNIALTWTSTMESLRMGRSILMCSSEVTSEMKSQYVKFSKISVKIIYTLV